MTIQEQMQAKLAVTGIPAKEIKCYGSQIMITAWSRDAAERWVMFLAKFSKVQAVKESTDYAKENHNTVLLPSRVSVWRVWSTI